jgi:hypothetical protein
VALLIVPVALLAAACGPTASPGPDPDVSAEASRASRATTTTTAPVATGGTTPTTAAPPTTAPTTTPTTAAPPTTAPTTTPTTAAPPTTAPTTTPTTQPAAPAGRDARQWPFASTSPWNTPIGSSAQFASPTADPRYGDLTDAYVAINAQTWSMPTYLASATDPIRTVTSYAGTWQYRIPDNAVAAGPADGDRHLLVIDPTGQYVDECWLASKQGVNWWCDYHVRNDLRGSGVLQAGVRAYGGSALGGLIRTWEIQQASIQHALAMAVPRRDMKHGPVWPANSEDGDATYGGSLPMGSLVSIPRTVNLNSLGLTPGGLVVAKALQSYGAYLVDASENFTLYAEPSAEGLLSEARSDLDKIRAQLRIVTNNSASTPGGGGTPIAATAPGFSG